MINSRTAVSSMSKRHAQTATSRLIARSEPSRAESCVISQSTLANSDRLLEYLHHEIRCKKSRLSVARVCLLAGLVDEGEAATVDVPLEVGIPPLARVPTPVTRK